MGTTIYQPVEGEDHYIVVDNNRDEPWCSGDKKYVTKVLRRQAIEEAKWSFDHEIGSRFERTESRGTSHAIGPPIEDRATYKVRFGGDKEVALKDLETLLERMIAKEPYDDLLTDLEF